MPKIAKAFRESLKKSGVFNQLDFIDDLQNVLNEAKRKLAEKGIHRKI